MLCPSEGAGRPVLAGRAYYRQPLKRHRKVCQSHFFYRPPVPLSRPVPAPIRCPARPSGGRHRPPLFAARSEYAEHSDAREGECGRRQTAAPPEPIARRGGATWAAARPPIGGRLAGRPICCQQRWHRSGVRAEALTRRTSGPSPMGSSPGRSSRPDTPRTPARFPARLWACRRAGGHARGSGNSCTG